MGQLIGIGVAILLLALLIRVIFNRAWSTAPPSFKHPASYVLAGGIAWVLYAVGSANGGPIYWDVGWPYLVVAGTLAVGTAFATLGYQDEYLSADSRASNEAAATTVGVAAETLELNEAGSDLAKRVRTALLVHGYGSTAEAASLTQALGAFQQARGLPVTNKIDPATLSALGVAL